MGPRVGFSLNGMDTGLSSEVCSDGEWGDGHEWQHRTFWPVLGKSCHGEGGQTLAWV